MASSVDPDETAHYELSHLIMSRLIWIYTVCKITCLGLQDRNALVERMLFDVPPYGYCSDIGEKHLLSRAVIDLSKDVSLLASFDITARASIFTNISAITLLLNSHKYFASF